MTRSLRSVALRGALFCVALALAACGQTPETTENARGLTTGIPVVVAMTAILIVVAGGLVVGALVIDRALKARSALAEVPDTQEAEEAEESDEIVAGIGVGRAPVPRWLYGFYVVIPLFAIMYVLNGVAFKAAPAATPEETKAPPGPVTEATIVAKGIAFDLATLTFPAETDVTVTFDNQDAEIPHTFTVWETEAAATAVDESAKIADTGQFNGIVKRDLKFTTRAAGDYFFNCIVHPAMNGTVEVVAAG